MTEAGPPSERWRAGDAGLLDAGLLDADAPGGRWSVVLGVAPPARPSLALRLSFVTACRHEAAVAGRRVAEDVAAFLVLVDGDVGRFASWLQTRDCELVLLVLEVGASVADTVDALLGVASGAPPGEVAAWRRQVDLDWVVHRDRLRVLVPGGPVVAEGRWEVLSRQLGLALRRLPVRTAGHRVVGRFGTTSTQLLVDRHPPDADVLARWVSGTVVFQATVPVTELDTLAQWLVG